MRKVFLENLPIKKQGKKNVIDWKNSVGYKVHFIYDDIEGDIEIIDYISGNRKNKSKILLTYKNKELYIFPCHFRKSKIGSLLNKRTSDFKLEIGQNYIKDNVNITIIDREYRLNKNGQNFKYYKYKCNKCGWDEGWILESNLLNQNNGCTCCNNLISVLGINTIYDTDKWMISIVGEEFAKSHVHCCSDKTICRCPDCGYEKEMRIANLYKNGFNCPKCGDRGKYPEKFMFNFLNKLEVEFKKEYINKWTNNKRYDFYFKLNNEEYIIETHGMQHYEKGFDKLGGRTLEEEQQNDKYKYELALNNGIKPNNYIVIDCRHSEFEFIKNNIINSRLNEIFNLNNIDWNEINENSNKNIIKEISYFWNRGLSIEDISIKLNKSKYIVRDSLKRGTEIGLCNYNPKEESIKGSKKINKIKKMVEIFKNGESLGIFYNCSELERQSKELFGVKLIGTNISMVANGKRKQYKGYTFKYID